MLAYLRRLDAKADRALALLHAIARAVIATETEIEAMSPEFQKLAADVAATKTVAESASKALAGIKAELDAALASADPPAALKALSDSLESTNASLAAAIEANTPAAAIPVVVVDPTPAPTT